MKWDLQKALLVNWQRGKLVVRQGEPGGVAKGTKKYESVGNFEKLSSCSTDGLFVASAACLSGREVVIKVCCKTCRIKTVGEADLLEAVISGQCAVGDYGLERIYNITCGADWILLKHTSETRLCQDF